MLLALETEFQSLLPTAKPPTFLEVGISQAYKPWASRLDVMLATPQAIANQVEAMIWDAGHHCIIEELAQVPYIEIVNKLENHQFVASTLTIPHRVGTAYLAKHKECQIEGKSFKDFIKQSAQERGLYETIFAIDPFSIIFGCFLSHIQGVLRIPRMLSAEFVAENAIAMPNGGASHDPIDASGKGVVVQSYFEGAKKGTKRSALGLGNVPYLRESYTAQSYKGYFVLDSRPLRRSTLPEESKRFLEVMGEYLIAKFLSEPVQLRSECFLAPVDSIAKFGELRDLAAIKAELQSLITANQPHWRSRTTFALSLKFDEVKEEEQAAD